MFLQLRFHRTPNTFRKPDILRFYCWMCKNSLFLPIIVTFMPDRIQLVSLRYKLRKLGLNSLNCSYKTKITSKNFRTTQVVRSGQGCLRRVDFNHGTKKLHLNSSRNPQHTGYTNRQNYMRVVFPSALQNRYFLTDFPVVAEKVILKGLNDF